MFIRPGLSLRILLTVALSGAAAVPLRAQDAPAPQVADAGKIPSSIPAHAETAPALTTRTLDPDGPPSLELADSLTARGRYLAAIRVYGKLQPTTPNIQNRMGVASERMLMFDQAQHCFEAALQLDPKMGDAWNNLGTVMHNRGDLGKAEKYYRKAIKLKPNNADAYQNLGALYYSKRNYNKGDAMYRDAMRMDPEVMDRTAQRGIQAGGGSKNQAEMHYHLACTFAQSGSPKLALDYLRRSIVEGFHDRNRLLHESSFADLRTTEPFLKMVDDLKNN
ncbi:tetratricopeptide repeat protein [Terriglobus sp.]|uniref:tetratricopeptide repeat protein n=1 Tax=Terriglobus sp. TaxID=1889013 RepID=UPI003B00E63D